MIAVRPRTLVHRGRHLAAAVVLDPALLGEAGARRRALALWEPGVRILALDGALLVRFPHPRPLSDRESPGLLLVDEGGVLAAAPVARAEHDALAPPPGAVVVVRAGVARVLAPGPELDPSRWLGLAPAVIAVEPLGAPPLPPPPPPAPPSPDVRRALGVAPASPAAAKAAAAIRTALSRPGGSAGRRARAALWEAAAVGAHGVAHLVSLPIRALLAVTRALAAPGDPRRDVGAYLPPVPSRAGPIRRALARALDRLLVATRVARLAGLWQGAYLAKLMRQLDGGDLDEALRNALPLGGLDAEAPLALGVPGRRANLRIQPGGGPTSSIDLHPSVQETLRRMYRAAFAQLELKGRHEEAAFVLAELLRADAEAVSYLERHGRLRLAAELAEARGLPAGLVVRQWFLAGDRERAVLVARTRGAYADAVARLERSRHQGEAAALRLVWAEDLAEAGDLEGAFAAARQVPEARALVSRWVALAVASGSDAGRALIAAWLELEPARFPEVRDRVLADCGDESEDGPPRRAALARGLLRAGNARGVAPLARALLRAALRDRAAGRWPGGDRVKELAAAARDAALDADLPRGGARAAEAPGVAHAVLRADDRGARPVLDAAVLPDGRVLVALGEAGAALLTRDGRTVALFDVPTHRLVVSDLGTRALALAPRGETTRVARLDLDARTAAPLRDVWQLTGAAASFDGARWWIATPSSVVLADALREDLRTLWHVTDLPGPPCALERDGAWATFVTAGERPEGWAYEGDTLRARVALATPDEDAAAVVLAVGGYAGGRWHALWSPGHGRLDVRSAEENGQTRADVSAGRDVAAAALGGGARLAMVLRYGDAPEVEVRVLAPADLRTVARVSLPGGPSVACRLAGERLTVADGFGRIVGIDLATGRVTHDLRT